MARSHQKNAPRSVLRTVFRRRRLFLLGASLFIIVSLLAAHHIPLKHTGVTKFERRSEGVERLSDKPDSFEVMKSTLQLELAGMNAVSKAVEDLGLTKNLPHGPDGQLTQEGQIQKLALIESLMKNIEVAWEARSEIVDVLSVSFTHSDPVLAERLPNLLVENYINRVSEEIVQRLIASRDFLLGKVKECDARMDQVIKEKTAFEVKHAGMLPENPGILQQTIQGLDAEIETVRRQETMAKTRLSRLKGLSTTGATSGPSSEPAGISGPNPEVKRIKDELQAAKEELEVEQKVHGRLDKHPAVVMLHKKIDMLEQRLKDTPANVPLFQLNALSGELAMQIMAGQADVEILGRDLERLENESATYQSLMANFGPIRQEYLQLLKKQEEARVEANRWQQSLIDVQMSLAAEVAKRRTHLNTIQAAPKQIRPSYPSLSKVLAFAVLGGLCFGAGLVYLRSSLDRSIQTSGDASSHFKVPIHGAVSEIVTPRDQAAKRFRRWVVTPILLVAILAAIGVSWLSITIWLMYPQKYSAWRASPITFVYSELTTPAEKR